MRATTFANIYGLIMSGKVRIKYRPHTYTAILSIYKRNSYQKNLCGYLFLLFIFLLLDIVYIVYNFY